MSSYTQLLGLYAFSLRQAKKLTVDLPAEKWAHQPAPHMNHAAWVIGHLAASGDTLIVLLGHQPTTPENWQQLFGIFSEPVSDASVYPEPAQLLAALEKTHAKLAEIVPQVSDETWQSRPALEPLAEHFPVLGPFAALILGAHESFHLGQLSAWRRVQGLPRV